MVDRVNNSGILKSKALLVETEIQNKHLINAHLERTCDVIIKHLKNVVLFQKEIDQCWGYHSRFIERMLHPEDKLIFKGTSKKLLENSELVRRKEHIVPMGFLLNSLWVLIEKDEYSDEQLVKILRKNLGIAYITYEEAKLLDSKKIGLKSSMPLGWCIETGDPLDRLRSAEIVLIDDQGFVINTLLI